MSFNHSPLLSLNNSTEVIVFNGLPRPIDIFAINNEIRMVHFNSVKDFVLEFEELSIKVMNCKNRLFIIVSDINLDEGGVLT